jgi:molecular chaperone DnaK
MRKDAEAHADEDRRRKELIEARNNADNTVYSAEKVLRDLGDKVPGDVKKQVEDQVARVREVLNGNDPEALRQATESLSQAVQQVGAAAYQQAGPAAGEPGASPAGDEGSGPSQSPGPDGGEDVVEGEYRNT